MILKTDITRPAFETVLTITGPWSRHMDVNYGYGLFTNSDPVIIPEPLQAGPGPFIGYWDSYTPAGEIPQLPLDGPRGWVRIAGNLLRSYDGYVRP